MNEPTEKIAEAINIHQAGKPESAIPLYQEHLACHPDDGQVIYLLGTALLQLGKGDESIEYLKQAEKKFPHIPDISNNTGIAYQSIGDWEQAENSFKRSIQINPDYGQAYFNYGSLLYDRNRLAEAETNLRQAVRLSPGDCEVTGKYADTLKDQQKWSEASKYYRSMIQLPQMSLNSKVNYAFVLAQQNRLDEAIEINSLILTQKPDYYQVYNSLGFLLEKQGKLQDALRLVERALEIEPEFPEGWNNKGVIHKSLYQFEQAKECFKKALILNPEFPLAQYNLGTTLLIQEDYSPGWKGYTFHTQLNQAEQEHQEIPIWNGEPIPEKKLLVYVDQGMGDAIMFIRFLDEIKNLSRAELSIVCPKSLIGLFRNSYPEQEFIEDGNIVGSFEYRFPLSQSPAVLDLEINQLPLVNSYIKALKTANHRLTSLLEKPSGTKKKVGLCWQGNPGQTRDNLRSCPLLLLETLLDNSQIEWYSFQVDDQSRELLKESGLSEKVIDLGDAMESFSDTSYALSRMDLMITVDTSMAHLAGAMQIPTWTMLCHLPDWRWHLERSDNPWYPGMELFRQPRWGDWNSVILDLKRALENLF